MADKSVFFKVGSLIFLVWAIASTVALAYYYIGYVSAMEKEISYKNKLLEINNTLTKIKGSVLEINQSYNELIESFQQYISRSVAIVVIDYGNGTIDHFKVYFIEGVNDSVFNITQSIADLHYTYYSSFNDVLIESINGVENKQVSGSSGYYWSLYINFRLSSMGAYHAKVSDGDIIIWNYTFVSW